MTTSLFYCHSTLPPLHIPLLRPLVYPSTSTKPPHLHSYLYTTPLTFHHPILSSTRHSLSHSSLIHSIPFILTSDTPLVLSFPSQPTNQSVSHHSHHSHSIHSRPRHTVASPHSLASLPVSHESPRHTKPQQAKENQGNPRGHQYHASIDQRKTEARVGWLADSIPLAPARPVCSCVLLCCVVLLSCVLLGGRCCVAAS